MKTPCKNCITLPICRLKAYLVLFGACDLIWDYLPNYNHALIRSERKLKAIENTLKPTNWTSRPASKTRFKGSQGSDDKLIVLAIDEDGKVDL